jgi:hypothetical protein
MQPWRRALVEQGLTFAWLSERTGKSVNTIKAYSQGHRTPPAAWLTQVDALLAQVREGNAA